jgi:hypothetical protein
LSGADAAAPEDGPGLPPEPPPEKVHKILQPSLPHRTKTNISGENNGLICQIPLKPSRQQKLGRKAQPTILTIEKGNHSERDQARTHTHTHLSDVGRGEGPEKRLVLEPKVGTALSVMFKFKEKGFSHHQCFNHIQKLAGRLPFHIQFWLPDTNP